MGAYIIAFIIAVAAFFIIQARGAAKHNIEFRKAFRQKCLEDEREHQDQR